MRPTDSDVNILERELNIELFYTPDTEMEFSSKGDARATTLGDIANISRFDWKDKK